MTIKIGLQAQLLRLAQLGYSEADYLLLYARFCRESPAGDNALSCARHGSPPDYSTTTS
ncbi:hypothetical protein [Nocardiopsis sp. Huas11]|uniref:hypothetical protein n=1 Tax=Nocardiopsis sp. Huas11 TaxID=2183912 RepID=UPI00131526D5|nr:hypothetical protein [Nocardiopsis sp. Huas11]